MTSNTLTTDRYVAGDTYKVRVCARTPENTQKVRGKQGSRTDSKGFL